MLTRFLLSAAFLCSAAFLSPAAMAAGPYSASRAVNAPTVQAEVGYVDSDGVEQTRIVEQKVAADTYGNAAGNGYDLAVDGAFEGQTVAVLHFYSAGFDFGLPKAALEEKGFSVYRWIHDAPSHKELRRGLSKSNQLWLISDATRHLDDEHIAIIKEYWESGHGVYIWGDNQPYYSDANALAGALFGGEMLGDLPGTVTVPLRPKGAKVGLTPNHDITTGLEYLYEGVTIATIQPNDALEPLLLGSAGNLVTAIYDHDGKRAVLDGGFTRLYVNWDTAGTARYVKNAAAWLVNYERFGDDVLASDRR
jgi:hypothetical protein